LTARQVARIGAAVVGTPSLWRTALRQWRRTTPARWWRRRPFLPMPPTEYVQFRLVTQYGAVDQQIAAADVLNYLAWCKLQGR
jgi:hypothetical protein